MMIFSQLADEYEKPTLSLQLKLGTSLLGQQGIVAYWQFYHKSMMSYFCEKVN